MQWSHTVQELINPCVPFKRRNQEDFLDIFRQRFFFFSFSCSLPGNQLKQIPPDCKLEIMEFAFNLSPLQIKLPLRNYLSWPSKWIGIDVLNCFLNCCSPLPSSPSPHSCFASESSLMGTVTHTRGWSHVVIKEKDWGNRGKYHPVHYLAVTHTNWIEIISPRGRVPTMDTVLSWAGKM